MELELSARDALALASAPARRAEIQLATKVQDAREWRAQLELAEVYGLNGVHCVTENEGVAAAVAEVLAAFGAELGPPRARRRSNAKQKLEDARQVLRSSRRRAFVLASKVHRSEAELLVALSGVTWIGAFESQEPPVGPRTVREEVLGAPDGARFVIAWGTLAPPSGTRGLRCVLGRVAELDSGNTGALGLAILLDRLLGEA
jgi:hypothetical protein